MKYYINYAIFFFLGVALGAFLLKMFPSKTMETIEIERVQVDTIFVVDSIEVPAPYPVEVISPVIPTDVDTAAVISEFFSKNVYDRKIIETEHLSVGVKDTVSGNKLTTGSVYYELRYPKTTKWKKTRDRVNLNIDTRGVAGVMWQRDKFVFSGGYDIVNKTPVLGIGINIYER